MAITALTEVETLEVSLVPKGANLKRRFPITKQTENEMSDVLHAVLDAPTTEDAKFEALAKAAELNEETADAMKGALKILSAYSDALAPKDALAFVAKAFDLEEEDEEDEAEKAEGDESEGDELAEEAEAAVDAAEAAEGMDPEAEKAEDDATTEDEEDEDDEEAVEKSLKKLPVNVQTKLDALFKANKEAVEKADKLEKALAEERDERLRKEFVAKANTDFPHIPGKSSEELGIMLKTLHGVAPKIAEDLENIFKSVSSTIEKADLLQEIGSGMGSTSGSDNAYGRLDAMAKETVSKSGDSYASAFEKAMRKNPELYSQYLAEQGQ